MALDSKLSLFIDGQVTGLLSALTRANAATTRFADQARRSLGTLQGVFGSLGVAISGGALAAGFKSLVNQMDSLNDASKRLGISTESLSALGYAAEQSGSSVQGLQNGLKFLTKNLGLARQGNRELADTFRRYGITAVDDTESALLKLAEAFAKMPDGAQKAADGSRIFGKAWDELIPLLNEGRSGIERFVARAKELGLVVSGEAAQAADEFNDSLNELSNSFVGLGRSIAFDAIGPLSNFVNRLREATDFGRTFFRAISSEQSQNAQEIGQTINRINEINDQLAEIWKQPFRSKNAQAEADDLNAEVSALYTKLGELKKREEELRNVEASSGKTKEDLTKKTSDNQDANQQSLETLGRLTQGYKDLAQSIRDSLDASKQTPFKDAEKSSVLDVNRLRDTARTKLDAKDTKGALRDLQQAQKINDALLESGAISKAYYQTQADLLLKLVDAAQRIVDGTSPEVTFAVDEETSNANVAAYADLQQQFIDQNPLYRDVILRNAGEPPPGLSEAGGETVPQLLPVPGLYASGGPIAGPGTATSDSVLARLSAGEYVVRAAAVKAYGLGFLERLNSMRLPRFGFGGLVPAFAGGGSVGAPVHLHIGGESLPMSAAPDVAQTLQRIVRTEVLKRGRR